MLNSLVEYFAAEPRVLVGNLFGLLATVLSFIAFQMKTPKRLMFMNSCVIVALVTSYAILGAWSGMILNLLCFFRNISYSFAWRRPFSYRWWPYACALILGAVGVISWQGWVSLLVIIPLMINTVFMSFNDNYRLRISVCFTSPPIIVYNMFFQAYMPILLESAAIVSSVIAIIRYRSVKTEEREETK